jgi:hypothetical protein
VIHWRRVTVAERQLALLWGGLALAVVALEPLWRLASGVLRPCVFRAVTGIPCPTCGATRGTLALLDGQPLVALELNPLVTIVAIGFVAGGVLAPLWVWRRGTVPVIATPLPLWTRIGLIGLIIANWAWVIAVS